MTLGQFREITKDWPDQSRMEIRNEDDDFYRLDTDEVSLENLCVVFNVSRRFGWKDNL